MKTHSTQFAKLAEDSKTRVKEIDASRVKKYLDDKIDFYLVDVREESEWAAGHLPQAIHLSKGVIERDIEKTILDNNALIILYCGGGYRSALAADNIQKMGYTNVHSMGGGYRGWCEAGYPLNKN